MERTTIAEAAKLLDLTQEAIRARIRRGTIRHEKGEDGKTYVYLTEKETSSKPRSNTEQQVLDGVVNAYIEALKSEIASLKEDREEWKEEARRKDTIIMALTNRIPELEEADKPRESPLRPSDTESEADLLQEEERRPWWRRIFTS